MADLDINSVQQTQTATPQLSSDTLNRINTRLSEIDSKSNVWSEYKKYDTNNNGSLSDETFTNQTLYELGQSLGIVSDGEIQPTKQGDVGDCWLLGGVNGLAQTDWGKEAISEAIDGNHAGTAEDPYTVTLYDSEGNKKSIQVTNEDIENYGLDDKKYSSGDIDMNLLEAAVNKYFQEEIEAGRLDRNINDPMEGNIGTGVYSTNYLLTGRTGQGITKVDILPENANIYSKMTDDNLLDALNTFADNPSNVSMTCGFKERSWFQKTFGTTSAGEQSTNHAYTITNVNKNPAGEIISISYTNPWDSGKEYTVPYKTFCDRVIDLSYITNE